MSLLTGMLESSCGTSLPMLVLGVVVDGFVAAGFLFGVWLEPCETLTDIVVFSDSLSPDTVVIATVCVPCE